MYKKEHPHFKTMLYREDYKLMFEYVDYLFEDDEDMFNR